MFRILTPIFAFLLAVGIGLTYIRPALYEIKATQEELKHYREAITKANELRERLAEKIAIRDSFDPSDVERLDTMIADDVHVVARLLDIDALARKHHLILSGIETAADLSQRDPSTRIDAPQAASAVVVDPLLAEGSIQEDRPVDTFIKGNDISFKVTGTYDDLRNFLAEMEKSLVLTDVVGLSSQRGDGDLQEYAFTVRFYSYNANAS